MKKTMLIVAGFGLASGLATAVQGQETQDPSEYDEPQTQEGMGHEEMDKDSMSQMGDMDDMDTDHESGDLTTMAAADLEGKAVQTATGEEIGEIGEIMTSEDTEERIATVEVGGFLGIGEKTIAIPLSDLEKSTEEDAFRTSMTRESIEAHPEFDEAGYTSEAGTMEDDDTTDY